MSARKKDDVVKPQIIDLEADAVSEVQQEEKPAATEPEPPPAPPKPKKPVSWPVPVAALVAGAIGGGWFYKDVLVGYFPPPQMAETQQAVAQLNQHQTDTTTALTALRQAVQQQQTASQDMAGQLNAAADASQAAQQRLAAMEKSLASLTQDIARLKAAPAPSPSEAPALDIAPLENRIAALEKQMADMQAARPAMSAASQVLTAFSALREKIVLGAPFADDLKAFAATAPTISIPDELSAASAGVASSAALGSELRAVIPSLNPDAAESDSGLWASVKKSLSGIVKIKSAGPVDWSGPAAAAAAYAETNNLGDAIAVIEDAGTPPPAIAAWLEKAKARQALEQALASWTPLVMQHAAAP